MVKIEVVQPRPDQAATMPYAPAVSVQMPAELIFISGATSSPLYHKHPHVPEEHVQPDDIHEQTRRAMENIKLVLDHKGLAWRNVVKVTKYLTDMREIDALHEIMNAYFGDWRPASTTVCINNLSSPGARVEIDVIAAGPVKV
jgi:2-iminobutanoate/2-iminopropanoate deaminase/2-aminomuconate deaminase